MCAKWMSYDYPKAAQNEYVLVLIQQQGLVQIELEQQQPFKPNLPSFNTCILPMNQMQD